MPYGRKSKHHGKTGKPKGRPTGLIIDDLPVTLMIYPTMARAREAHERFRERGVAYLFSCVGQGQPLYGARYQRARIMVPVEHRMPDFWEWIDETVRCQLREPLIKEH